MGYGVQQALAQGADALFQRTAMHSQRRPGLLLALGGNQRHDGLCLCQAKLTVHKSPAGKLTRTGRARTGG